MPKMQLIAGCPRTAQGWIPMVYFREEMFEGEDFLVQNKGRDPCGGDEPLVLIDKAQAERGEEGAPAKIVGEWRYIDELAHMEPVAFQPLPMPSADADIDALKPALAA